MRHLILGTAGHIDHGKTTLIRALTGIDTDRLAEEKRRGITIDLGFAELPLEEHVRYGVVDVPGHEGFVRNMLAGATGMDVVLLAVAADEGVMPQTREHLAIVELLGVRDGLVAVTKTDLVEPAWLELVTDELREQLAGTVFADAPIIPVSARTGQGLDALRDALIRAADRARPRPSDDLFRLPVDRAFTVRGTGTVVTGTVWSGHVAPADSLTLLPSGLDVRVRDVQVHSRPAGAAAAGERAALALAGIDHDQVGRGDVLVDGAPWRPHSMLTCRLRLIPGTDWSLRTRQRVRIHLGTAEAMARVVLFDAGPLAAGQEAWAQLRLESPLVARAGDRFVIRSYSPVTTIGGGTVVEPHPPKRRRLEPETRRALTAIAGDDVDAGLVALAGLAAWLGTERAALPLALPHPPAQVQAALERLDGDGVFAVGERVYHAGIAHEARDRVLAAIHAYHSENPLQPGAPRAAVRRALPAHAPPELAEWAVTSLVDESVAIAQQDVLAEPGFEPSPTMEQRKAMEEIVALVEGGGLAPPGLAELPEALSRRPDFVELLGLLEREGRVVRLTPELCFAPAILTDAECRIRDGLAGRSGLGPSDFRDLLPVSRKYLIPILEHMDRVGVTRRAGELRGVPAGQGTTLDTPSPGGVA